MPEPVQQRGDLRQGWRQGGIVTHIICSPHPWKISKACHTGGSQKHVELGGRFWVNSQKLGQAVKAPRVMTVHDSPPVPLSTLRSQIIIRHTPLPPPPTRPSATSTYGHILTSCSHFPPRLSLVVRFPPQRRSHICCGKYKQNSAEPRPMKTATAFAWTTVGMGG